MKILRRLYGPKINNEGEYKDKPGYQKPVWRSDQQWWLKKIVD